MIEARRSLAVAVLCGCSAADSIPCGDDQFCPTRTTCGGANVCLADPGACSQFPDGTPCVHDDISRGYCEADTCAPGVRITGVTSTFPGFLNLPGIEARVRGHPEVLPIRTNVNGYFDLIDVQRNSRPVLELSSPQSRTILTREVATKLGVAIDVTFGGIPIIEPQIVAMLADAVGASLSPGRGIVVGEAFDLARNQPLGGVAVAIPDGGCVGPVVIDQDRNPVLGATTFPEVSTFFFFDCAPGANELSATFPGRTCFPLAGDGTGPIPIDIPEDLLLHVGRIDCTD